ncbi:MAG TPA: tetratricopeptide repeat protein [Chromatiales bacterium]|nr:tetratricopeptide repeat protein [Chromatiales bacterium]
MSDPNPDAAGRPSMEEVKAAVLATDATPEAMTQCVESLGLSDGGVRELVDSLNARSEEMALGEHPAAMLEIAERTLLLARQIDYKRGIATSMMYAGVSHWFTSNIDRSLQRLMEARRLYAALDDEGGQMRARGFEGGVYRSIGDHDQSYLDLKTCVQYFRDSGDAYWEAVTALSLAITCEQLGDYDGVEEYSRRIIQIVTKPRLYWMLGRALNGLATIRSRAGRFEEALDLYQESLDTCRKAGHPVSEARSLNDIGVVWQRLGDTDKARQYYEQSLAIRRKIHQREAQCTCLFHLGDLAIESDEPQRALEYFKEALNVATEVQVKPRISQAHRHLSQAHEACGDVARALHHYKLFHKISKDVAAEQSETRLRNLTARLELDKAEKLAEFERNENAKLSEKNDELQQLLEELRQAQAHLVQSEKMAALGKLVAGVAHELNSPVGASAGSVDVSRRCIEKLVELVQSAGSLEELRGSERLKKVLDSLVANNDVVSRANERISRIVSSLKSFTRLDEADFQTVDIHDGLDATVTLLEPDVGERVTFRKAYGTVPRVNCYPSEMNQVFLNVLTNSVEAIHRSGGKGEIRIDTRHDDGHVVVEVHDDGDGIASERLETLFDPTFSGGRGRVKAGMGLFVSHGIVRKHNGTLRVTSEVGSGTTVTVAIPAPSP